MSNKKKVSDKVLVELARAVADGWNAARTAAEGDGVQAELIDGYVTTIVRWLAMRAAATVKRVDMDAFTRACHHEISSTVKSVKRPKGKGCSTDPRKTVKPPVSIRPSIKK